MLNDLARKPLLLLAGSDKAKNLATTVPATRDLVARYVAGERIDDAVQTTALLAADNLMATLDYLGEDVATVAAADDTRDTYLELLQRLKAEGLTDGGKAEVSVKLTALGLRLDDGEKLARERLGDICDAAADAGTTVTVDMEDRTLTDVTLRIVQAAREKHPATGCVVQAMLHRTQQDCENMAVADSRTRLCKGAYDEPESVAYSGHDIDTSYVECLATLMARPGRPMVATHDPRLVAIAETLAAHHHRDFKDWEIQMLLGVRPQEQKRLAGAGRSVRVYVPFGNDWWGYMVRRMAERPANLGLFMRSLVSRG